MEDIEWMLDDHVDVCAVKADTAYLVQDMESGITCVITWGEPKDSAPCMLFDGEYIETESFMGFVGLLDTVDESPNKRVIFHKDMTVEEL